MAMSSQPYLDAVVAGLNGSRKMKLGENGSLEYTDEGLASEILALNQLVRGGDPTDLTKQILERGSTSDIVDLVVLLFATRNARGGKGEKKLAYDIFLHVCMRYPDTTKELLRLFPHFGYWKDLLLIIQLAKSNENWLGGKRVEDLTCAVLEHMKEQLLLDIAAEQVYQDKLHEAVLEKEIDRLRSAGPEISLLVKWLPREGSALDVATRFVSRFSKLLWPAEPSAKSKYRKTIAKLTSYLGLPEVLLALQREEEIRFSKLASKATMRLRKVFLNEDKHGNLRTENPKRVKLAERFIQHVTKNGLNGSQLMPHEIVGKILKGSVSKMEEIVLDAQWKDLWSKVVEQVEAKAAEEGSAEFNPTRMVPLADVSGSMDGVPMEVSIALSIGISEITHDAFKNLVLTFETTPRWHKLCPTDTIVSKVRSLSVAPWDGSTNFAAAYDLMMDVVEKNNLSREDMPSLIVFSDMQFDQADDGQHDVLGDRRRKKPQSKMTMHERIRSKVNRVGQKLGWDDCEPTPIVFWNLRNTGGHPVDKDTEGAVLLAGYSPAMLKLVMHGEALREVEVEVLQQDGKVVTEKVRVTPETILRKMLDDSLYDPVREVLWKSQEGKLKDFEVSEAELAGKKQDDREGGFELI